MKPLNELITGKANELYPVVILTDEWGEHDINKPKREAHVAACQWLLSELAGDERELEEVLCEVTESPYKPLAMMYKEDALKAMQEYGFIIRTHEISLTRKQIANFRSEIQSLQQQLKISKEDTQFFRKQSIDNNVMANGLFVRIKELEQQLSEK